GRGRGLARELQERARERWPRLAGDRVAPLVAVAAAVAAPAERAAVGHRHLHHVAARRDQVAERRGRGDRLDPGQQRVREWQREPVQQPGLPAQRRTLRLRGKQVAHGAGANSSAGAASNSGISQWSTSRKANSAIRYTMEYLNVRI